MARIELTDTEWMSIIDQNREGLPTCCGNVSDLRDALTGLARNGGVPFAGHFRRLEDLLEACYPEHEVASDAMGKIMAQVGFAPDGAAATLETGK